MIDAIPPAAILIIGSLFVPLLKGFIRHLYVLLLPVLSFINMLYYPAGSGSELDLAGLSLTLVKVDSASLLWGYIFHLITLLGGIYLLFTPKVIELAAAYFYSGAALGVVFAGDYFTLFSCWELLTFGAVFLILARNTPRAYHAATRYLLVHIAGGLVLFGGVIIHCLEKGSLELTPFEPGFVSTGALLIFIGFGINCAWPVLHAWLTDAYPEATIGGVVFMSALTTKTAVYTLWRLFPGEPALIYIGAAMAAFPIFYAVIENDLRRVLAYSMINQVGFMVVGIGIGTELSLNGAAAHVFTDVLFKGLLFMSIGAVMYRTGKSNATELGGLYRTMPFTCLCCIVGAASISAFPLFSGFVSKSMIMSAAAEEHATIVWFILLFAAAGVFHHAGIKIPFFAFFSHDSGLRPEPAPMNMKIAMGLTALACILLGTFPQTILYPLLPFEVNYHPYTVHHVVSQLQLLIFSALAFCMLLLSGLYPAEIRSVNVDADVFYRRGGRLFYRTADWLFNGLNTLAHWLFMDVIVRDVVRFFKRAPTSLALFFLSPVLALSGADADTAAAQKATLARMIKSGALPIGYGVVTAVTVMFLLFFSLLAA